MLLQTPTPQGGCGAHLPVLPQRRRQHPERGSSAGPAGGRGISTLAVQVDFKRAYKKQKRLKKELGLRVMVPSIHISLGAILSCADFGWWQALAKPFY